MIPLLVWVVTCGIWSTVWLFIKIGVTDMPPITFAIYRLAIALSILVPLTIARRIVLPSSRRELGLIAGSGVLLLGANYAALYWGMQYVSSGLAAVLQAMTPGFGMMLAAVLLPQERATPLKAAALLLGVFGVGLVFADQLHFAGGRALLGGVAVLGGGFFVALAYVLVKQHGHNIHPNVMTAGQMMAALPFLIALAVPLEGNILRVEWSQAGLVSLLYLALLGSVTATWLNYWLLKRMDATKVLLMGLAEVPTAMAIGAAVLGETLSMRAIAGSACVLIGITILMIGPRR